MKKLREDAASSIQGRTLLSWKLVLVRNPIQNLPHSSIHLIWISLSGDTPHFGAPGWICRGSETIKASDKVFQRLIGVRS